MYIPVTMKVLLAAKVRLVPGQVGSGSENANKRCEATELKVLISAYKDHQEENNNSKSNKGKNLYGRRFLTLLLNIAKRLALEVCMTFVLHWEIAIRL